MFTQFISKDMLWEYKRTISQRQFFKMYQQHIFTYIIGNNENNEEICLRSDSNVTQANFRFSRYLSSVALSYQEPNLHQLYFVDLIDIHHLHIIMMQAVFLMLWLTTFKQYDLGLNSVY